MRLLQKPFFCSELEKSWKQHLVECFIISLFGPLMGSWFCENCYSDIHKFFILWAFSGLIWISQWKGHSFLADYTELKVSWFEQPRKRFILTILALLLYTSVSITLVHWLAEALLNVHTDYFTRDGFIKMNLICIGIGGFIYLFSYSSEFLKSWRQSEINAEKLRADNIASQFETLKNQVNPHFLFNSLNVLTNLVYADQDKAAKFIKKLAEVYHYVLEQKDKDLVPVEQECEFADSFLFLQGIRFGDNLKISNQCTDFNGHFVPPLVIQMLLENAIKHNEISKDRPLHIRMDFEDDYLVVSNNLQRKNILEERESHIGLRNIIARYAFLTKKEVIIKEDKKTFVVKLPLIKKT